MFPLSWIFGIRIGTHPRSNVSVANAKYLFDYLLYPEEASKRLDFNNPIQENLRFSQCGDRNNPIICVSERRDLGVSGISG